MKIALLSALLLLTIGFTSSSLSAQSPRFTVVQIDPYDKAASGEIMELLVEGLSKVGSTVVLPAEDFKLTVAQDGVSQEAKIRTVTPIMKSDRYARSDDQAATEFGGLKMHAYQSVHFVVPYGLHPGDAELTLSYRGQTRNAIGLTIVDTPLRPVVGTARVIMMNTSELPRPGQKLEGNDLGWRLERGSIAQLMVSPMTDPDDPKSAVLVRFKQGENIVDIDAQVRSQKFEVQTRERGIGFFPPRDILEVEVPAGLVMGPVQVEIRLRANGKESEPSTLSATITDASQAAAAPALNAPRLLLVTPTRVGAGQSMLLSLDYRRTLDPDPSKTRVVIEQGAARYLITPEINSAAFDRNRAPDMPVMFLIRPTKEIIGKAQVRIFNELRGQQTGMSDPVPVEILSEPLAPEIVSVNVSSKAELAHLQQMYELATRAGSKFPDYDPARKYLTIRVKRIDLNPNFVRITLSQEQRRFTLKFGDFSSYSNDVLIVRLPLEIKEGQTTLTIENRGADSFSNPDSRTFELCCIR